MARNKRRKATGPSRGSADKGPRSASRKRKSIDVGKITRRSFLALGVLAIPGLIVGMEVRKARIRSDISVIGQGRPVIVQAHDPGCPDCRSLLSNAEEAHADFRDTIEMRVVNINSGSGREFAREYQAGRVTLLLFDGSGSLHRTLRGVRSSDELRREFSALQRHGER